VPGVETGNSKNRGETLPMAQAPDADEARVLALGGTTFPQLLL